MTESDSARRRLEVLAALLERAPLYRAISGSTALAGGLLSLGGFATAYYSKHHRHHPLTAGEFRIVWLAVLLLTLLANFVFLCRAESRENHCFLSPARRCAWRHLAPAFLTAAVLTFVLHHPIQLALAWLPLYGLGLLSTQSFAPRSLAWLGGFFLLTGAGLFATWRHFFLTTQGGDPSALVVSGILAGTFGGLHLAYAAWIWASGEGKN